ncbi:proteasome activator complex subunit 2 [Corythoichthys intestinalis]|uniref:proteasome activator complex subunit 2 n=1 Tax=Corythoichthys intestinalis TaxID=161448 RepID=UPI0025A59A19|nr:proteasome activator complex subunit 2 [Corythoichthys intestinalis]XP_061809997.1 proteasome activator complex subunit 2-like [Nerophis lumbriciformis]
MPKNSELKISVENAAKVESFNQALLFETNNLFSVSIPAKILKLNALLQEVNGIDMSALKAPLDIPIPDPPNPDEEEMETNEEKKKKPKCGFIKSNETILELVGKLKPEIANQRETFITVACWIQHFIPKIEDGNDFGVAIQEKILERIAAVRTKVDGFQPNINKYFLERGDAVAKASKDTHVMDYRSLVNEKDVAVYSDIRTIILDLRSFYVELYDMISKNMEKVTNPKGEEKPSMY